MELITRIGQLLLSLMLLVLLHELGHFIAARIFKTRVEKFYLFFNPWFSLYKKKKGQTEYGIGWLPLGGYVKIAGMIDESMDKKQMQKPAQPDEFRSKKTWQRLIIILAGIFVNIVLAILINIGIVYTWGETFLPSKNITHGLVYSPIAKETGFQDGDKIVKINDKEIQRYANILPTLLAQKPRTVEVLRAGVPHTITIKENFIKSILAESSKDFNPQPIFIPRQLFAPIVIEQIVSKSPAANSRLQEEDKLIAIDDNKFQYYDEFEKYLKTHCNKEITLTIKRNNSLQNIPLQMGEKPMIGIKIKKEGREFLKFEKLHYTFLESISVGYKRTISMLSNYIGSLSHVFSKEGANALGGIGTMAQLFPTYWDWQVFWGITSFLSIILAFINILPIPGLDGGHAIFIIYEMISGRKPGLRFMEVVQTIGILFLISLMIFANGNDLFKSFR